MDLGDFERDAQYNEFGWLEVPARTELGLKRELSLDLEEALYSLYAKGFKLMKSPNRRSKETFVVSFEDIDWNNEEEVGRVQSLMPRSAVRQENLPRGKNWIRSKADIWTFVSDKGQVVIGGKLNAGDTGYVDIHTRKAYISREWAEAALPDYTRPKVQTRPISIARPAVQPKTFVGLDGKVYVDPRANRPSFVIRGDTFKFDGEDKDWTKFDGMPVTKAPYQADVPKGMIKVRIGDGETNYLLPANMVIRESEHLALPDLTNQQQLDVVLQDLLNEHYDTKAMVFDLINGDYLHNGSVIDPDSILQIQSVAQDARKYMLDNPKHGAQFLAEDQIARYRKIVDKFGVENFKEQLQDALEIVNNTIHAGLFQ